MYDPQKLCTTEKRDGKQWHVANPADVIPPTLKRIQEVLATKWQIKLPDELINLKDDDPSIAAKGVVQECAALLANGQEYTAAWVWFKRALSLKVGRTVLLHITRDEQYRESV